MAVLERNSKQKYIIQGMSYGLLMSALVYLLTIMSTSSQLTNDTGVREGKILGLRLFEVSKLPANGGGYMAGLKLNFPGITIFVIICMLLGLVYGLIKIRNSQSQTN